MNASEIVGLAACIGQLALALLSIARATRSQLAVPLALLCLDIFGWMGADLAWHVSGVAAFHWIDHVLTPWTAPLALQFVLTFAGRRRALRPALFVACGTAVGLSLVVVRDAIVEGPATLFTVPRLLPFLRPAPWSLTLMSVALPTMVFAMFVVGRHMRDSVDPIERARARLILAALAIGTVLGSTEELGQFVGVPALGNVGMLATSAILAVVTLRFRLFDRDVSPRAVGVLLALAAGTAFAALVVLRYMGADVALYVLGATLLTLFFVAASRRWIAEGAEQRLRREQLTTLGRFSAQMAHDLKNPLAALKGAAQLLRQDVTHDKPAIDRVRFLDLMLQQIERLDRVVDVYGRLGRVEPDREPVDLNEQVRSVVALQSFASETIHVRTELEEPLPPCRADRAMLARVMENLLRNAMEAMPQGGTIVVRTAQTTDPRGAGAVELSVEDAGCGMDARTRERAFDEFFTTKPAGSGLGLAFVNRVVEAHGGRVSLSSELGRGTVVRVRLPSE
jgi:signal transduction histidine kinase